MVSFVIVEAGEAHITHIHTHTHTTREEEKEEEEAGPREKRDSGNRLSQRVETISCGLCAR